MKKIFSTLLAVLLCFTLIGCNTNSNNKETEIRYEEIVEKLSKTKIVIVNVVDSDENGGTIFNIKKTITDEKEIEEIITIMSNASIFEGAVTMPLSRFKLEMLDADNNKIAVFWFPNMILGIEYDFEYNWFLKNPDTLEKMLES